MIEENIMTEKEIQTCTYELCCEPSMFAWPEHCKKHYLYRTKIKGMMKDLRLKELLDLIAEKYTEETRNEWPSGITLHINEILREIYFRRTSPRQAVKKYNMFLKRTGELLDFDRFAIKLTTYHWSWKCPVCWKEKIVNWYETNMSPLDKLCSDCRETCTEREKCDWNSQPYIAHSEIIGRHGVRLVCELCYVWPENREECVCAVEQCDTILRGADCRRLTIINPDEEEEDTSDICINCWNDRAHQYSIERERRI